MIRYRRNSVSVALALLLGVSFALAACGRKGPLDPPPSSSVAAQPGAVGVTGSKDEDSQEPGGGTTQAPKKRIPLDVLLN